MLWRVEDTEMYLLGSVHIMGPTPLTLSPSAEQAYRQSERVVFESNIDETPDFSVGKLPAHERLSQLVPPELWSVLRQKWAAAGLKEDDLERFHPWLAALILMFETAARRKITAELGVDKQIWNRAGADDLERVTLEPRNAPLAAFASTPLDEQIRFLSHIAVAGQTELNDMMAALRAGQLEPLEKIHEQRHRLAPRGFHKLMTERNQLWLPQLIAMAADGIPTLVVVGALHCVGADGLPALLTKSGRVVSRAD